MTTTDFLLFVPVLLASIVLHEVAHGWQARREGDPTAEKLGRITLNPIPHLDFIGSIMVPLFLWYSGAGFLFGWAKPVPVNPTNFRTPRWSDVRVSLAGIVVNLALAVLFTVAAGAVATFGPFASGSAGSAAFAVLRIGIYLNLILAFFNLLPIPPLDGSHVLAQFLPPAAARSYRAIGQFGMLILVALFFIPGAFNVLLWPVDVLAGLADSFIRLWI